MFRTSHGPTVYGPHAASHRLQRDTDRPAGGRTDRVRRGQARTSARKRTRRGGRRSRIPRGLTAARSYRPYFLSNRVRSSIGSALIVRPPPLVSVAFNSEL